MLVSTVYLPIQERHYSKNYVIFNGKLLTVATNRSSLNGVIDNLVQVGSCGFQRNSCNWTVLVTKTWVLSTQELPSQLAQRFLLMLSTKSGIDITEKAGKVCYSHRFSRISATISKTLPTAGNQQSFNECTFTVDSTWHFPQILSAQMRGEMDWCPSGSLTALTRLIMQFPIVALSPSVLQVTTKAASTTRKPYKVSLSMERL